jgi:hypothetical protein
MILPEHSLIGELFPEQNQLQISLASLHDEQDY